MPDGGQLTAGRALCRKWMPRKQTYCARTRDHGGACASPEKMERQRQRSALLRPGRVIAPETKARWNRAHKFVRLGITEEDFDALLKAQGYACGMCREPFKDGRICVDHNHNCCEPDPEGHTKLCGKCIRGLLCFRCNTALGYIEAYGARARAYLDRAVRFVRSP